jgi:hypothetical protein
VTGHPPAEIVQVLATLRQFLREGTPWRSLRASAGKASGSTLIVDSCSVRARRGGELMFAYASIGASVIGMIAGQSRQPMKSVTALLALYPVRRNNSANFIPPVLDSTTFDLPRV